MSSSNNSNSNQPVVPSAREALNKFKMEAAQEVGVNLKQGYNGDLTSREAGSVGGVREQHAVTSLPGSADKNRSGAEEFPPPRFCLSKKSAASGNVSLPPHPCTGYTSFSTTSRISVKRPFSSKQYHAVPSWSCPSVSAQAQEYWRDRPSSDQARGTHRG